MLLLLRQLHGGQPAFMAALLFVVDFTHYRAVFWISAISFGPGLLFLLISLLLLASWSRSDGRPQLWMPVAGVESSPWHSCSTRRRWSA